MTATTKNEKRVGRLLKTLRQPHVAPDDLVNDLTFYLPSLSPAYAKLFPKAAGAYTEALAVLTLVVHELHARHEAQGLPLRAQTILDYLERPELLATLYHDRVERLAQTNGFTEDSAHHLEHLTRAQAKDEFAAHHRTWMLALKPAMEVLGEVAHRQQKVASHQDAKEARTRRASRALLPSV